MQLPTWQEMELHRLTRAIEQFAAQVAKSPNNRGNLRDDVAQLKRAIRTQGTLIRRLGTDLDRLRKKRTQRKKRKNKETPQ